MYASVPTFVSRDVLVKMDNIMKMGRKALKPLSRVMLLLLTAVILTSTALSNVQAQLRSSTSLTLSPSTFEIRLGNSIILTATLTSNGEPLQDKSIEFIATLGTVSPNIGTTNQEGKVTVNYTAPVVSVHTTVKISASFLGDLKYKASNATSSGTIEAEPLLPKISIEGAAFIIPESMRVNISQYIADIPEEVKKTLPLQVPSTGFFLATRENLTLVLADQSDKGIATVEGWMLPNRLGLGGISLDVILAEDVSFHKEGKPATVNEILTNPEDYEYELVKVLAFRRQISILYDPDDGSDVEVPLIWGYLTEEHENATELIRNAIRKGRGLIEQPSRSFVEDILRTEKTRLTVFDYDEYGYWTGCQAETNGILLLPNSSISNLLQIVPVTGGLIRSDDLPVLYDVKRSLVYENVSSVEELNQNPEKYIGKVVGVTANGFGGEISIQECIREATGEDIPVDILLEGVESWNTLNIPPKKEELLTAVGASNIHQDEVFTTFDGVFKYIGRVISASQIDESLPAEAIALVIYQRQKIGEIDYQALAESAKEQIENKLKEAYFLLTNFMEEQPPSIIPIKPPIRVVNPVRPIAVATPEDLPRIISVSLKVEFIVGVVRPETLVSLEFENLTISKVEMKLKETREHVNMTIEKLRGKPPGLPEPEGVVWAYTEVGVNVPDEAIESARVNFWILKGWLETHGATAENVTLLRYHAGRWESLPTDIEGENLTHIHYSTETSGFSTFAVTVIVAAPVVGPSFSLSSLSITPETVQVGESVEVSVNVKNSGELEGAYAVSLKTNGTVESIRTITLAGGQSKEVKFLVTKGVAGTYSLEVDGLAGIIEVTEAPIAKPQPLVLLSCMGIAIIVIIVIITIRKTKKR